METTLQYPHHLALQSSRAKQKASGSEGAPSTSPVLSPAQAHSGTARGTLPKACAASTGTSHQRKVYNRR